MTGFNITVKCIIIKWEGMGYHVVLIRDVRYAISSDRRERK
jgi:hypothetical protein